MISDGFCTVSKRRVVVLRGFCSVAIPFIRYTFNFLHFTKALSGFQCAPFGCIENHIFPMVCIVFRDFPVFICGRGGHRIAGSLIYQALHAAVAGQRTTHHTGNIRWLTLLAVVGHIVVDAFTFGQGTRRAFQHPTGMRSAALCRGVVGAQRARRRLGRSSGAVVSLCAPQRRRGISCRAIVSGWARLANKRPEIAVFPCLAGETSLSDIAITSRAACRRGC